MLRPCQPSPCGPNSQCREINEQAVCSCLPNFIGSPPQCRPECIISSECSQNQACLQQKCANPCVNVCGQNAICQVRNHSPICICLSGYSGDPFTRCQRIPPRKRNFKILFEGIQYYQYDNLSILAAPKPNDELIVRDPCSPSPCGSYAQCRNANGVPSCSCLPNFIGSPPGCKPECVINQECVSSKACIRQRCDDPCLGACGFSATCTVRNHAAICTCFENYVGDPFTSCSPKPVPSKTLILC